MVDQTLGPIVSLVARARRRLQLQRALDWGTSTAILAVAGSLVVLWAYRTHVVSSPAAVMAASALGGAVLLAALLGGLLRPSRAWPTALVATRLDRASALADRLGTACDFAARLGGGGVPDRTHPDTRAMMVAAIADGVAAATRADVRAATPLRAPRDVRALAAFTAVAIAIAALAFPTSPRAAGLAHHAPAVAWQEGATCVDEQSLPALDGDEIALIRLELDDLRLEAVARGDELTVALANELDGLLAAAGRGELSKADLLDAVDELLGRPGHSGRATGGRLADVRDAVRRLPPPPPPPTPPVPPGNEPGVCTNPGQPTARPLRPAPRPQASRKAGNEHDAQVLGAPTPRVGRTHDEEVAGVHGAGASRRETIRTAARRGFATHGYMRVYADYRAILEEQLSTERVPQGYRTAVKRYFGLIHPQ